MISGSDSRDGFSLSHHLIPALAVVALLLAMEATCIDSAVASWFFDPSAGVFPLRHHAWLEIVGHQWTKLPAILLACSAVMTYVLSFVVPELAPQRRLLLFLSLALTLAPLAVVMLKAESARHCPWSLKEYGGFAQHLSLFEAAPPGSPPGHCFPGGHSAAGFCLFALYFAGLAQQEPGLARAGLCGGLAAGLALGMVRVAQGAHFLSHVLWSGVVCWLVILTLYMVIVVAPRRTRSGTVSGE